jgi:hypothetical protein
MPTITKSSKSKTDDRFTTVSRDLARSDDRLTVQATKLQQENHYLRRANRVRPHLKIVLRAEAAARLLALWHCAGYLTSRRACLSFGMSERSFFAGRAFLIVARIHDGAKWLAEDPEVIESKMRFAAAHCRKHPHSLALRMPLSRRPKSLADL